MTDIIASLCSTAPRTTYKVSDKPFYKRLISRLFENESPITV